MYFLFSDQGISNYDVNLSETKVTVTSSLSVDDIINIISNIIV